MGRMYSVEFSKVTVIADQDLFELTPADDRPIAIHAIYLSQSTLLADAAEEILNIKVIRGLGTSGSGGGTSTPAVLSPLDTAAGFTCEVNNDTIATSGTPIDLHSDSWNVRTGLQLIFAPDERPVATQANTLLCVRLMENPTSQVMSGTCYVEELV